MQHYFKFSLTPVHASEAGKRGHFRVALSAEPWDAVTVRVVPEDPTQLNVTEAKYRVVSFNASNWHVPKDIFVDAVNDAVEELRPHSSRLVVLGSSDDVRYNGAKGVVDITIADDDYSGVVASLKVMNVTEGSSGKSYNVRLNKQPNPTNVASPWVKVELDVASGQCVADEKNGIVRWLGKVCSGDKDCGTPANNTHRYSCRNGTTVMTPTPHILQFTHLNWNTWQAVKIVAVDDALVENDTVAVVVTHRVTSSDPMFTIAEHCVQSDPWGKCLAYSGARNDQVRVDIRDNDRRGIVLPNAPVSLSEGGAGRWPATNQVLSKRAGGGCLVTALHILPSTTHSLVMLGACNPEQNVSTRQHWVLNASTLQIQNEGMCLDAGVTTPATGPSVRVCKLAPVSGYENQQWTYNETTFQIHGPGGNCLLPSGAGLGSMQLATCNQADAGQHWNLGLLVESDWHIKAAANGALSTQGYSVSLRTEPLAKVTIHLTTHNSNASGPEQVDLSAPSLVFTTRDWQTPQYVWMRARDDGRTEASPHATNISHRVVSADAAYTALKPKDVVVRISDKAAVRILWNGPGLIVKEASGFRSNDSYSVTLLSEPRSTVIVRIRESSNSTAPRMAGIVRLHIDQLLTSTRVLSFHPSNWSIAQVVSVAAVDDRVEEDRVHSALLSHTVESLDPDYHHIVTKPVPVNITDNTERGVRVSTNTLTVSEGGAAVNYTISLAVEPRVTLTGGKTDVVKVELGTRPGHCLIGATRQPNYGSLCSKDAHCGAGNVCQDKTKVTISPSVLTFHGNSWHTPQIISVTAIDDSLVEPNPHPAEITHISESEDLRYHGLDDGSGKAFIVIDKVAVSILENDMPGLALSGKLLQVSENGQTDTYGVTLKTAPWTDVDVIVHSGKQLNTSMKSLRFTPISWNTTQLITVSAIDDNVDEGVLSMVIMNMSLTSNDAAYTSAGSAVSVVVANNDIAALVLSSAAVQITEGHPGISYNVSLASKPVDPATGLDTMVDIYVDAPQGVCVDRLKNVILRNSTCTVLADCGAQQYCLDRAAVKTTPSKLVFGAHNFNVPQTVLVAAYDDHVVESTLVTSIQHRATSKDPRYNTSTVHCGDAQNLAARVTGQFLATNKVPSWLCADGVRDHAGSCCAASCGTCSGSGCESRSGGSALCCGASIISSGKICSSPGDVGCVISLTQVGGACSASLARTLVAPKLAVTVHDNDVANLSVSTSTLTLKEGRGLVPYTIVLNARPLSDVVIRFDYNPHIRLWKDVNISEVRNAKMKVFIRCGTLRLASTRLTTDKLNFAMRFSCHRQSPRQLPRASYATSSSERTSHISSVRRRWTNWKGSLSAPSSKYRLGLRPRPSGLTRTKRTR